MPLLATTAAGTLGRFCVERDEGDEDDRHLTPPRGASSERTPNPVCSPAASLAQLTRVCWLSGRGLAGFGRGRYQVETGARLTRGEGGHSVAFVMRGMLFTAAVGLVAVALAAPASANYHQVYNAIPPGLGVYPSSLAVDQRHADGPLYALDAPNHRVLEVTTLGNWVGSFGSAGYAACQLEQPWDIAIGPSSGNVYFSDSYNGRVVECTPTGGFVNQFETRVTPGDIAIIPASADGPWQLIVAAADYDNNVETIEANGHWIVWGQSGDGPGQFPWPPDSMTADPTNRVVYVSVDNDAYDNEKARIEKFTPEGTFVGEWSVTNAAGNATPAYELTVDPAGDVLAVVGNCIVKYGPGGRLLGRFACEGQNLGALATDRAGNLFVTDLDSVQAFQAVYPKTTITSGPTGGQHWSDPQPQFQFAASQSGATYRCHVDAEPGASCPTPFTSPHLGDGTHTISVRATDADGLTGPVTQSSFVIDTKPPDPRISGHTVTLTTGGVAKLKLTCPASEASGPCGGDLFLQNVDQSATNQGLEYLLGFATFSVPAGDTKAVPVQLIAQDRAIIAKLGSIHAQVTVDVHDDVGNRTNGIVQAFKLNAP
jgi:hypothetical protein